MNHLLNKAGIFLFCSYFFLWDEKVSLSHIAILLTALTVSCLCSLFDHPIPLLILYWGVLFLCLKETGAGFFLPVLLYDIFYFRRRQALIPVLIGVFATTLQFPSAAFLYLLILFLSTALSLYCRDLDQLHRELHHIRDESREHALTLRQRSQALIAKQNADIRAATLTERNRIAREIHDNVGHMLTRSILQVGALKVINGNAALEKPIEDLQHTLNTAMTSVRTSVHDLHDDAIDLSAVIHELTEAVETPAITLEYDMEETTPKEIKYAFIAIVREAVNNMQKHSNATNAQIRMREHPGFFLLHIADNGTRIQQSAEEGIGLNNMEERIRTLGGTIRFDTTDGFKISIMIRKGGFK